LSGRGVGDVVAQAIQERGGMNMVAVEDFRWIKIQMEVKIVISDDDLTSFKIKIRRGQIGEASAGRWPTWRANDSAQGVESSRG
jgi:hypothetical protein